MHLSELNYQLPKRSKLSERSLILKEITELYEKDAPMRKKENWRRYCLWCKTRGISKKEATKKENTDLFRKDKFFIKTYTPKQVAITINLCKIPTQDLYYCASVMRDKIHRGESAGAWLFGSMKPKIDKTDFHKSN